MVRLAPQERVQWIGEQKVEVSIRPISEDIVGEFKIAPKEHLMPRICEEIVNVPVAQVDVLEALQFQVRAIPYEIHWEFSDVDTGQEEFSTETHELDMQLGVCSMKINAIQVQRSGVLARVRDRVWEC